MTTHTAPDPDDASLQQALRTALREKEATSAAMHQFETEHKQSGDGK